MAALRVQPHWAVNAGLHHAAYAAATPLEEQKLAFSLVITPYDQ